MDRDRRRRRRRALRERAIVYKGSRCNICGYDHCDSALDFHHVDDLTKEFAVSDRLTSWERIVGELDKCVLLCCRCHREVHDGLHPTFLTLDDGHGRDDELLYEDSNENFVD